MRDFKEVMMESNLDVLDDDGFDWENFGLVEILEAALEKAHEEVVDSLLRRQVVDSLEALIQSIRGGTL